MKINFLVIGKTNNNYIKDGIDIYQNRLKKYIQFSIKEIPELKNTKKISVEQIKEKEFQLLKQHINTEDEIILLDEKGKEFTSKDFANYIENKMIYSNKNLTFVVGGAYGYSKKIYQQYNQKISCSKMTFSHQMIRLIFIEQLYRAFTIIKGEPYHHK